MVPFRGVGAGIGELSWGQAEIWSAMVTQQSSLHIGGVAEFPVPKSLDEIVAALSWMFGEHQSLRTRLRFDDGVRQVVAEHGEVPLRVVDVDDDADPAKIAADIDAEFREVDFDYEHEWPVRLALIRQHGVPTHLVAIYCHLAIDLAGMNALFGNGLFALLFTDGGADLPEVDTLEPLAQVAWQRSPAGRRHDKAVQRYWRRQVAGIPASRFTVPGDEQLPRHWQVTFRSSALQLALQSIAARTSAESSTILLAAAATALVHVTGRGPAVFQIIVSNRFRPGLADTVSVVSQGGLCVIDVAVASFDDVIERTARSAMKAYLNAYFDRNAKETMLDEIGRERGERIELTCFYNDRRAQDSRIPTGPPPTPKRLAEANAETTIEWGPHADKPWEPLFVNVNDAGPDVVEILLQADTRRFSPDQMRAFLVTFEATLMAAAALVRN
ncbi:MAG TPA: condensation domain-containing protein [Pseudonocardiaceae bacterium]|nr:condensation domain-containing protein [Pseudonocardiaceae bacterium]